MAEFRVDEIYSVPEVGTVVGGLLTRGIIREGDKVLVGPTSSCSFTEAKVASIHRFRSPCWMVKAMQSATLALKEVERADVRKVRQIHGCWCLFRSCLSTCALSTCTNESTRQFGN